MKKILAIVLLLTLCLTCFFACKKDNNNGDNGTEVKGVEEARNYLKAMYKDAIGAETAGDYEVTNTVKVGGVSYAVTWAIEIVSGTQDDVKLEEKDANTTLVKINGMATEETSYKLIATIKDDAGETATLTFESKVPKFKALTYAEYIAAKKGDTVSVEGIVSGMVTKTADGKTTCTQLYLQDKAGLGGYYIYTTKQDAIADYKLEIGMTVIMSGEKDIYNGTHEIKNATLTLITDSNKIEVVPTDITEIFKAAGSLSADELMAYEGAYVTIKGVEITGEDTSKGYYNFKLGNLESYIRISSSSCMLSSADQKTFTSAHKAHAGYLADATGIVSRYNGNFYLVPVNLSAFVYSDKMPERTNAEKIAFEKSQITFVKNLAEAGEISLRVKGNAYPDDVIISWASDNANVVVSGDKLIVTLPAANATVKLTATFTCGDATDTAEFTVKLWKDNMTEAELLEALKGLEAGESLGTRTLTGEIVKINSAFDTKYNNITVTIKVAGVEIQCFRMKGDDAATLAVGDIITVTGVLKNYNGTKEFDAGCTCVKGGSVTPDPDPKPTPKTEKEIVDAAYALGAGESLDGTYTLKGTITEIKFEYTEQYGISFNFTVAGCEDKPIYCYKLMGSSASALKVGDSVTLTGTLTNYVNKSGVSTIEMINCTLKTDGGSDTPDPNPNPNPNPSTAKEILDAAYALAQDTALEGTYTLTGKVITIKDAYNSQFNNVSVIIVVDNYTDLPMVCFRMKGDDAATVAVGDTITVTGTIKNYKGTVEFDANCTFVTVSKGEGTDPNPNPNPNPNPSEDGTLAATITFPTGDAHQKIHEYTDGDITITFDQNGAQYDPQQNKGGFYQLYAGNLMKIQAANGKKIVKVVINFRYSDNHGAFANLEGYVENGNVGTWTGTATELVEFLNTAGGQAKIASIEIYVG